MDSSYEHIWVGIFSYWFVRVLYLLCDVAFASIFSSYVFFWLWLWWLFKIFISNFHGAKWFISLIFLTFVTCSERLLSAWGLKKCISWSWKNRLLIPYPHSQYTYTQVNLNLWARDLTCILKRFPWLRLTGPWPSLLCLANMTRDDYQCYFTNRRVAQVLWGGKGTKGVFCFFVFLICISTSGHYNI